MRRKRLIPGSRTSGPGVLVGGNRRGLRSSAERRPVKGAWFPLGARAKKGREKKKKKTE